MCSTAGTGPAGSGFSVHGGGIGGSRLPTLVLLLVPVLVLET